MHIAAIGELVCLGLALLVFGTLAYSSFSAAPWVPLSKREAQRMMDVLAVSAQDTLYDLGCGDGRLLVAAAARGARAIGYEIALMPYLAARIRVLCSPYRRRITIRYRSFWNATLAPATCVACFLTPPAMGKLEPKLDRELTPGARFATYAFRLPGRQPAMVHKPDERNVAIYLYRF